MTDILPIYPFILDLILLPGPLYVHLSWAPRWRLLCMIDDGKNPFEGQETIDIEEKIYPETDTIDEEIESVVDDFETSEE